MRHYLKRCEDFTICGGTGDTGDMYLHGHPDNYTIYHIIVKGAVKVGRPFESDYTLIDTSKTIVDVKKYLYDKRVYMASEPYQMYGFNPLDIEIDWGAKLVDTSFTGDNDSWLICFKGNPIVNGVQLKTMDYAKLYVKNYDVKINDGILGVFTKL